MQMCANGAALRGEDDSLMDKPLNSSSFKLSSNLSSMTGFSRLEGQLGECQWTWEMRSVNGRGLDIRFRLPYGFEELELRLRKILPTYIKRGTVNISLDLREAENTSRLFLNRRTFDDVISMIEEMKKSDVDFAAPRPEGILSIRGVVETQNQLIDKDERQHLYAKLEESFLDCVKALDEARRTEGRALQSVIVKQIEDIAALLKQAETQSAAMPEVMKTRLKKQISEVANEAGISEERLAQEVAMMVVKADIREETDRLNAHLEAAYALLQNAEPVGRKFDFLVQEFNREINTLCSKAPDIQSKQTGLAMKTIIDQLREQIQNVV